MSIKIMTRVWDESKQKGSALLLLLAIADHAADDGFCWPGHKRLAKKIRMSTRSVARIIAKLEQDKDLYTVRKNGEHNWYVVRVGMTDQDVIEVLKNRKFDTPDNLSPVTHVSSPQDIAMPEPMTQLCHPNLHEASSNHQEKPSSDDDDFSDLFKKPDREPITTNLPTSAKGPLDLAAKTQKARAQEKQWTTPQGDNDTWTGRPVDEWCALIGLPIDGLPTTRRRYFGKALQILAIEVDAGPPEAADAIRSIAKDERYHWLRSAGSPSHRGFAEIFQNVLCGLTVGDDRTTRQAGGKRWEPRTAMGADMVAT